MRTRDRAHAVEAALQAAWFSILLAIGLTLPDIAPADDLPATPPDAACMKQCAAAGFDDDYCDRACTVPAAHPLPPGLSINWDCATQCRTRGDTMGACVQACRRN
jgi:hypothetical protein